jgi:hypothetical protein
VAAAGLTGLAAGGSARVEHTCTDVWRKQTRSVLTVWIDRGRAVDAAADHESAAGRTSGSTGTGTQAKAVRRRCVAADAGRQRAVRKGEGNVPSIGGSGDAEKAELAERRRAIAEANPLYPHPTPAAA